MSTSGPRQADAVRAALAVRVDGAPLFTSVQSTWNVLEPSAGPALAEAAEAGAWVIVKEAVANGRLAPRGADDGAGAGRAAALAAELGVGVDQLAIAAALGQPWAWRVLSGAVRVDQLRSNVAAESLRLPVAVLDELATLPRAGRVVLGRAVPALLGVSAAMRLRRRLRRPRSRTGRRARRGRRRSQR